MMQHSFKLMWNQKRKYGFILLELFVIFVVIFMTTIYMIDNMTKYFQGTGTNIERVYFMKIHQTGEESNVDPGFDKIRQRLAQSEFVREASLSHQASPYVSGYSTRTFHHGENLTKASFCVADSWFPSVLQPELKSGRWFRPDERTRGIEIPAVINQKLAAKLFPGQDPIGKTIQDDGHRYVVQGVIDQYKRRDFRSEGSTLFIPFSHWYRPNRGSVDLLIRYPEGAFPKPRKYAEVVFSVLPREHFQITQSARLEAVKQQSNSNTSGDMLFVTLIVGFLLFNLMLGLVGILGYHVNQRISEMGIRRAVGSTRRKVRGLIFLEMLVLTLMATIPALFLVVQIPALELMPMSWGLFIQGMLVSLAIIAIFVSISVMYPGIVASKIRPALALKEE